MYTGMKFINIALTTKNSFMVFCRYSSGKRNNNKMNYVELMVQE